MTYLGEDPLGDVHDLLRRPGALDRGVGEAEHGVPFLEVLDGLQRLLHVPRVVVGADAGGVEGLG